MSVDPRAGKPAGPVDPRECSEAHHCLLRLRARSQRSAAASRFWHFRPSRLRLLTAPSTNGTSSPSRQAICDYRKLQKIDGPLFLGIDTHALSEPAFASALEVLAANDIEVMVSEGTAYTPTPAVSHAILEYNQGTEDRAGRRHRDHAFAQSPRGWRFQVRPTARRTSRNRTQPRWIEAKANESLRSKLAGVKRMLFAQALRASTTHKYDYLHCLRRRPRKRVDMQRFAIPESRLGVDPLGGAGIDYWPRIAEHYGLNLTVVNKSVDPTFRFMTVDWDGKIRMDPSSPYAMQSLIGSKGQVRHCLCFVTPTMTGTALSRRELACCRRITISPCAFDYLVCKPRQLGQEVAVGKDRRQQQHDRSRDRATGAPVV